MVVVSNGFSKFHLSVAAAEAYRRGNLKAFITGAYPTPTIRQLLRLAGRYNPRFRRLSARKDSIPEDLVAAIPHSEAIEMVASWATRKSAVHEALTACARRRYAHAACRYVADAARRGARLYHYRAGFGHDSVRLAKRLGLFTLCDHSIAHPTVLNELVERYSLSPKCSAAKIDRIWTEVLRDIQLADAVLVNSDFVQQTFLEQGWSSPVHVIYLGVDSSFLESVPKTRNYSTSGPLRLLFAGTFERRKGSEILMETVRRLTDVDFVLEIAGYTPPEVMKRYRDFFHHPRVHHLGILARDDLARAMSQADVFVFPSAAEGSARVIFEALACGCYVITTPNAGSIVQDGIHGQLIPPGSSAALQQAIRLAADRRELVRSMGERNAQLVRRDYTQSRYGDALNCLYRNLLNGLN